MPAANCNPVRKLTIPFSLAMVIILLSLLSNQLCFGVIIQLKDGGVISGRIVGSKDAPVLQIITDDGIELSVDRTLLKDIHKLPAIGERELEYAKSVASRPDTAEENMTIAKECYEKQMLSLEFAHLERVVELDPDNTKAWNALKFVQFGNKWMRKDASMQKRGKIKGEQGGWYTWQENAILITEAKKEAKKLDLEKKIDRYLNNFNADNRKFAEAKAFFDTFNDPLGIDRLMKHYKDGANKVFILKLLKQIPQQATVGTFVSIAMDEPVVNIAIVNDCIEFLLSGDEYIREAALAGFARHLKDTNTRDRAAYCMTNFADKRFIGALINSLVSSAMVTAPTNPGAVNAGFTSNGGTSFGSGSAPPVERQVTHKEVLQALIQASGGQNFGFDQAKWRYWFAENFAKSNLDLRRDDF